MRNASDLGFEVLLVADATWTVDMRALDGQVHAAEQVHQMSLATLAGSFAEIAETSEVISALAR